VAIARRRPLALSVVIHSLHIRKNEQIGTGRREGFGGQT